MRHDETPDIWAFGLIREEYFLGDLSRTAYGVAAYAHPLSTESATIVTAVHDITSDRDAIEHLIRRCNRARLLPEQLHDVVADWFSVME